MYCSDSDQQRESNSSDDSYGEKIVVRSCEERTNDEANAAKKVCR